MKLVVGLGNPGKEYELTRHNMGFYMLDNYLGDVKWSKKFNGYYYEKNINGEKYIFLKPLSYMNLSGGVVREYVDYYKIDIKDILVIQDDLDLSVGKIRIKINSSAGGHNGIKDIINCLGTNAFIRLKIGVSQDRSIDTKDYVLGKLSSDEKLKLQTVINISSEIIDDYLHINFDKLMNKYNK